VVEVKVVVALKSTTSCLPASAHMGMGKHLLREDLALLLVRLDRYV
jgi:hypothetical protein